MATDRLINSTQGDSIIGKLDDIKTAINNQSTAATATPLMDGAAAVGTSTKYARENHVHPTDTSRAANVMSTYAIDTARENITTSSTVQSAIEQLEYREETNKNNILSRAKLYTVSKPSDGIVNTATFDWSQLVSGTYMITCMNVTGSQHRYGISIYTFYKFGDGSIGLWTDISDITSAKISSYVVTDDTLTLTYDVYGYHNVTIINLNILS